MEIKTAAGNGMQKALFENLVRIMLPVVDEECSDSPGMEY
jgi:hypothetical protein